MDFDQFFRAIYDIGDFFYTIKYPDAEEADDADLLHEFYTSVLITCYSTIVHDQDDTELTTALDEWLPHLRAGEEIWRERTGD